MYALYDARIPAEVVSARHFDAWWKKARRTDPDLLTFTRELLVNAGRDAVDPNAYPDAWLADGVRLPLSYQFEPSSAGRRRDRAGAARRCSTSSTRTDFGWSVPGFRKEVVIALIRALPKALRTNFVPVPDWADAVLDRVPARRGPLPDAVGDELRRLTGTIVPRDAWQPGPGARPPADELPGGRRARRGGRRGPRPRRAAPRRWRPKVQATISAAAGDIERRGITTNDFGVLPRRVAQVRGGYEVNVYPALVDEGD